MSGFICDQIRTRRAREFDRTFMGLCDHRTLYVRAQRSGGAPGSLPGWQKPAASNLQPMYMARSAYRTVNREATLKRRQAGLDDEQKKTVMPIEWFDQWWTAVTEAELEGIDHSRAERRRAGWT